MRKVLSKMGLNSDDWESFDLVVKTMNCKVTKAKELITDDKLLLKEKYNLDEGSEEEWKEKEEEEEEENQEEKMGEESNLEDSIITSNSLDNWLNENDGSEEAEYVEENDEEREENAEDREEDQEIKVLIDVNDLKSKTWSNRDELNDYLKIWASDRHIKVSLNSQARFNKNGTKVSTWSCSKKKTLKCSFSLEFRTKDDKYELYQSSNEHNHKIFEYDNALAITPEIYNRIQELIPVTLDSNALTKAINQEFDKNFHHQTIYYQTKKVAQENLGMPTDDANNFIKLLSEDAKEKNGFYKALIKDGRLKNCCYMSNRMKNMADYFSDVLIIDTSHKINRFNLPMLDIVCVNNLGRTTTVFVGLLGDQTYQTFLWILENFKNQLAESPKVIFTDEEEALTKGKFNDL